MPWWRVAIAVVLVGYGLAMAAVTIGVTAHSDDPYDAMATSGNSGILVAVGLATISPLLLRARCGRGPAVCWPAATRGRSSRSRTSADGRSCSAASWHR